MTNSTTPLQQEIDLREQATCILKTILLMDKAYSSSYIARIVSGNDQYGLKLDIHRQLETFGNLEDMFESHLEDIIFHLVSLGFIHVMDEVYGTLKISQLGEAYLSDPQEIIVEKGQLYKAWYEIQLKQKLRQWRKDMAEEFEKFPYQIFTNYTLSRIVTNLPSNMAQLKAIKGFNLLEEHELQEILDIVMDILAKKEIDEENGLFRKAYSPSHRKVKELFEGGISLEEMARRRKLKVDKVVDFLLVLHEAKEINLIPWIALEIDSNILIKVSGYFSSASDKSLDTAQKSLGVDSYFLKLGKLYATRPEEAQA
ncbi:MAG: RQC domain-containing protein [Bacteroidota bacterium]